MMIEEIITNSFKIIKRYDQTDDKYYIIDTDKKELKFNNYSDDMIKKEFISIYYYHIKT